MTKPCPVCGTVMDRYVPIAWNCAECDRDYWIEGGSWWYCDVDGEPEVVKAATDGGSDRDRLLRLLTEWGRRAEKVSDVTHNQDTYFNGFEDATRRCIRELKDELTQEDARE